MKILTLSDLHFEADDRGARGFKLQTGGADLIVFAGDIDSGVRGFRWAARIAELTRIPVVYVAGNHEYWGYSLLLTKRLRRMAIMCRARGIPAYFLERDEVHIQAGGELVRLLGATLWSDFSVFGDETQNGSMEYAAAHMPDYRLIHRERWRWWKKITPSDTLKLCEDTLAWLWETAMHPFDGPTVFVTHNAPSRQSIHVDYEDHILTPAFSSDFEQLVNYTHCNLWIHGHVHHSNDYKMLGTRVVCNPRGDRTKGLNPDFDPRLLVEV